VLLAVAVLMGMAREQNWGQKLFGLKIRTTDAEGLRAGMEVRIAGLPVGKVASLNLESDAKVAINLEIQERYRHLVGPRSRAHQGQDGIVGDQFTRLRDGDRFYYERLFQGKQLKELRNTHLSDIIKRNTTITNLQTNVFFAPDSETPTPTPGPAFPQDGGAAR
jgi:ABC-type transporter Mla subunit MlaD